jgi:hypothetical protein
VNVKWSPHRIDGCPYLGGQTGKVDGTKPANHREPVTQAVIKQVKQLAAQNTPTRVIGLKIQRTEADVRAIAANMSAA